MQRTIFKSLYLLSFCLTFSNVSGQTVIYTTPDNSNFLGKRFDTSFENFTNICNLSKNDFKTQCDLLGFDTEYTDNFCIIAYPQCRHRLQNLTKCDDKIFYYWDDARNEVSTLSSLYDLINAQINTFYYSDGFKCFRIAHEGNKYTFCFKSEISKGHLIEVLLVKCE